jgi:hypothetical protein
MEETTVASAPPPSLQDSYWTEEQFAAQLPKGSVRKLREWRRMRIGPPWVKIGREVVYLRRSALLWMEENQVTVSRASKRSRK